MIIRVRNERDALMRTLQNFDAQVYDGRFEVIVIDNESTDGSKTAAMEREQGYSLCRAACLPMGARSI